MILQPNQPELIVTPPGQTASVRTPLTRALTSLGSDPAADVRVAGLPAHWAVLQRGTAGVSVRLVADGLRQAIQPGQPIVVDGVRLELSPAERDQGPDAGLPMQALADALAAVEAPDEALAALLEGLVKATSADSGAIILREPAGYSLPLARTRNGGRLDRAEALLSDSIVMDVLEGNRPVRLSDAARADRYRGVPSVVDLRLRAVLCVPMQHAGRVLGAVFLGRRHSSPAFTPRQARDLESLATLVVPLLIQLRRLGAGKERGTGHASITLVGECTGMRDVRQLIERVGPSDLGVMVLGQTGTGKELVARAIHAVSGRAARPLVAVNCAAIPEGLLAGELFGARKGAYTGALSDRKGLIEQAHGSTLFLDEVGDMPAPMQAALLRVLETREVVRLGENRARPVDFRLVCATCQDLEAEVGAGRFRRDLLYRLSEFEIRLPALIDRGDDVGLLAQLFLRQTERELGLPGRSLSEGACAALSAHPWPGNVRELRAVMRRAAILVDDGPILPEHLRLDGTPAPGSPRPASPPVLSNARDLGDLDRPLAAARDDFVRRYVSAVLERSGGDRQQAAARLGISIRSLYRHIAG